MRCRYCATISREVTRPFAIASRLAGLVASTTVNTGVFGPWAPAPHATAAMPTAHTMSVCFIRRVSYDSHATVRLKADATYVVSGFSRTIRRTWRPASAGLFRAQRDHRIHA